jgi:hypothetical protein
LVIPRAVTPLFPLPQKSRPGRIRLSDENDVSKAFEFLRFDGRHCAAHNSETASGSNLIKDLDQATPLNAHARETDHVSACQALEVDILYVLIDNGDIVVFRHERGEERKAGNRKIGSLSKEPHTSFHPPEGHVKTGIYDNDIGHIGILPTAEPEPFLTHV